MKVNMTTANQSVSPKPLIQVSKYNNNQSVCAPKPPEIVTTITDIREKPPMFR